MSTVGLPDIPYDVLVLLFTHLEGNRRALYASCLASRALREAAQECLYRHVQLDYYAKEYASYSALKTLQRRPHLRPYVRSIDLVLHAYATFGLRSHAVLSSLSGLQSFTLRFQNPRPQRTHIHFSSPPYSGKT
ncbi:hypothetical protein BDZ89DRAFT_421842 [Hymenopellis radicata]|nr:hypothetical protein BDZ89DRAFT_421842 [Hymenopellis radicata]